MKIKLSEIIDGLHQDDDFRKLSEGTPAAGGAGADTKTEVPVADMVGDTVEDEKAKIQTRLTELAGGQNEAISAAKTEETLNTAQKAPAGEAAQPTAVQVSPAASAEASEVAEVVASALGGMQPEVRKIATVKIIEKIASMNAVTLDDLKDVKVAEARANEYDAAGRIMARSYHDETNKLAEKRAEKLAAAEAGKGEGDGSTKEAAAAAAAAEETNDDQDGLTNSDRDLIASLEA